MPHLGFEIPHLLDLLLAVECLFSQLRSRSACQTPAVILLHEPPLPTIDAIEVPVAAPPLPCHLPPIKLGND